MPVTHRRLPLARSSTNAGFPLDCQRAREGWRIPASSPGDGRQKRLIVFHRRVAPWHVDFCCQARFTCSLFDAAGYTV